MTKRQWCRRYDPQYSYAGYNHHIHIGCEIGIEANVEQVVRYLLRLLTIIGQTSRLVDFPGAGRRRKISRVIDVCQQYRTVEATGT